MRQFEVEEMEAFSYDDWVQIIGPYEACDVLSNKEFDIYWERREELRKDYYYDI